MLPRSAWRRLTRPLADISSALPFTTLDLQCARLFSPIPTPPLCSRFFTVSHPYIRQRPLAPSRTERHKTYCPLTSYQRRHVQVLLPPERGGPRYRRFGRKNSQSQYQYSPNVDSGRQFGFIHLWRTNQNFRLIIGLVCLGSALFYVSNTETVPVSGRRRFNMISPRKEAQLASSMYTGVLAEFGDKILHDSHPYTRLVRNVMKRLIPISGLEDLDWEVHVIAEDSQANAFVIPGGKVFVFSGLLPLCKTSPFDSGEAGLAAVLSHEISHVLAHHASERISQLYLVVAALWITAWVLGGSSGFERIVMDLLFLRPRSRKQEAEADYIGLMMMAKACYDPESAVSLWRNMEAADMGQPPQFLSTHPAHSVRVENIKRWLPEARKELETSDCQNMLSYAREFRNMFNYQIW